MLIRDNWAAWNEILKLKSAISKIDLAAVTSVSIPGY